MTNLSKTFDDSFKKEVIDLIKQGLKKELPAGAVYSASKKPPEGAREFTTDRGTKYWIPSKKDKEDSKAKQAKPKADIAHLSDKELQQTPLADLVINNFPDGKLPSLLARYVDEKGNLKPEVKAQISRGDKTFLPNIKTLIRADAGIRAADKKMQEAKQAKPKAPRTQRGAMAYDGPNKERSEAADRVKAKTKARREEAAKSKASSTPKQAKPEASGSDTFADGKPKMGKKSFTNKQRKALEKVVMNSWENLSDNSQQLGMDSVAFIQDFKPQIDGLTKKMQKGTYDREAALKVAMTIMNKMPTRSSNWGSPTSSDKRAAAKHWVKEFESDYANGEYEPGGQWHERLEVDEDGEFTYRG